MQLNEIRKGQVFRFEGKAKVWSLDNYSGTKKTFKLFNPLNRKETVFVRNQNVKIELI
jgi:hypothetical protein